MVRHVSGDQPDFYSLEDVPAFSAGYKKQPLFSRQEKFVVLLGVIAPSVLWFAESINDLAWLSLLGLVAVTVVATVIYRLHLRKQEPLADPITLLLWDMSTDEEGHALLEKGDKILLAFNAFDAAHHHAHALTNPNAPYYHEHALESGVKQILARCDAVTGMQEGVRLARRGVGRRSIRHPETTRTIKRLRISLVVLARSLDRRQGIYLSKLERRHAVETRKNAR
ncbi:hypothetical protein HOI18_05335 [Candidatus Uhrbacteria bacterium]|jgi:hypothetical protein|nr:hypothetical protein [Candidatus Uhrbacteria bacterium]